MVDSDDEQEFKPTMQKRPVFGAGAKKIVSLPPREPSAELERAVERSAEDDLNFRHRDQRKSSLIPSSNKKAENRGEEGQRSLEEWVEVYLERLANEQPLQRPTESYRSGKKDRFAQVMPAYLSAALTAVAQANGFNKEWQLIEYMLEELGAFEERKGN